MSGIRQVFSDWGHTLIDLAERVYRMVRGLPHNRNATIVVAVGCTILAGPFWEPYLRAWFEKLNGLHVELPTEPMYGVVLIVLGLSYHIAMTWLATHEADARARHGKQTGDRTRAHDTPIFDKFIADAPEQKFTWALNCLRDDHAFSSDQSTMITNAYYFLDTVSNEFNDKEVQAKADTLKAALDKLTNFTAQHFFVLDQKIGGAFRHALEPHWNWDRGGNPTSDQDKRYHALGTELSGLVGASISAYNDLLRIGHLRLL